MNGWKTNRKGMDTRKNGREKLRWKEGKGRMEDRNKWIDRWMNAIFELMDRWKKGGKIKQNEWMRRTGLNTWIDGYMEGTEEINR